MLLLEIPVLFLVMLNLFHLKQKRVPLLKRVLLKIRITIPIFRDKGRNKNKPKDSYKDRCRDRQLTMKELVIQWLSTKLKLNEKDTLESGGVHRGPGTSRFAF